MGTETKLKGLIVIVIALILGVLMIGTVWTNSQLPAPTYYAVMLKPNGDFSLPPPNAGNWTTEGCADPDKYECIDEDPQDGNTTFIVSDQGDANIEMFTLENMTIPSGAVIDSVSVFAWLRGNTTGTVIDISLDDYWIFGSNFMCTMIVNSPGVSFQNYSQNWGATCNGPAWDLIVINTMILVMDQTASDIVTLTMAGAIVYYAVFPYTGPQWDLMGFVPLIIVAILILIVLSWWKLESK